MPITNGARRSPEELTRLGLEIQTRRIEPLLTPADAGKFVAIAVDNEAYEVHQDDFTAVARLLARHPTADVWLGRVGKRTTCRIGLNR